MTQVPPDKLPIGKVVLGAFFIPWWQRRAFFKALALPALSIVALSVGWRLAGSAISGITSWLLYLFYCGLFTLFAVSCHRLVLLGPSSAESRLKMSWSQRESRFLGWLIGVYLIYFVVSLLFIMVLATIAANISSHVPAEPSAGAAAPATWFRGIQVVASILATYFLARLSLVFPAAAIGQKVDMRWSWEHTKHNGWRLAIVVGVLPWVLSFALAQLYREGSSVAELIMLVVLGVLALVVEIAALSLSYRELSKAWDFEGHEKT